MERIVKGLTTLLLFAMVVACPSCDSVERSSQAGRTYYNRYNIHYYQKEVNVASYANWTDCPGHGFLPYNTELKLGTWGRGFKLVARDSGTEVLFEFRSANMRGMSVSEYIDLIMSPAPVSYEGLNAQDEKGIKAGKAIKGMTKQGVMIALGYPAMHRTPSTDSNSWIYWRNRFMTRVVEFDESGKVVSINP